MAVITVPCVLALVLTKGYFDSIKGGVFVELRY